jgi:hypothetical protein
MLIDIDLKETERDSSDLARLASMLEVLAGQRCLKVDFDYGPELMLHVGTPIPYSHPRLKGEQKGSWILGTRASRWQLLLGGSGLLIQTGPPEPFLPLMPPTGVDVRPISPEEVEKKTGLLSGFLILSASPFPTQSKKGMGFGVAIEFGDGSRLLVVPTEEPDDPREPLADWELFTPFHTYLRVGPGVIWSKLPSNGSEANGDSQTVPSEQGDSGGGHI